MDNDRSATITIGGQEYPLILTTLATKEIGTRYGGLQNLGEKLMKTENFAMALDEVNFLIILLANQAILRHNYQNKDEPKELLTMDFVELFTEPHELANFKNAITEALYRGTKRHIESEEPNSKNPQGA
jgi:hypothetical protein